MAMGGADAGKVTAGVAESNSSSLHGLACNSLVNQNHHFLQLNIPDSIYSWIKAFFEHHLHYTRYAEKCLTVTVVKASTRFWTESSLVYCHRSRPAPDYARESYFQICRRHAPCGNLLTSCSSLLYVMRVLHGHGISTESLHDVFRATILAKITYCLSAWSGLCSASDHAKLDSFLNCCKRLGFCDNTVPIISDIFSHAYDSQFKTILKNSYHVLYPYLPENKYQHYRLRHCPHNKALIPKTSYLSDLDYIMHMLYKNCY